MLTSSSYNRQLDCLLAKRPPFCAFCLKRILSRFNSPGSLAIVQRRAPPSQSHTSAVCGEIHDSRAGALHEPTFTRTGAALLPGPSPLTVRSLAVYAWNDSTLRTGKASAKKRATVQESATALSKLIQMLTFPACDNELMKTARGWVQDERD